MKKILLVIVLFLLGASSHAFAFKGYARTGEELCNFIDDFSGGLNEASLMCAMGAGAGKYSPDECAFCNKLILERRLTPIECLTGIAEPTTKAQLDKCEALTNSNDIVQCLVNP